MENRLHRCRVAVGYRSCGCRLGIRSYAVVGDDGRFHGYWGWVDQRRGFVGVVEEVGGT